MLNQPSVPLSATEASTVYGVGTTKGTFKIEVKPSTIGVNATYEYMIESQGYSGSVAARKKITITFEKIDDNCLGGVIQSPFGTPDRKEYLLDDPTNTVRQGTLDMGLKEVSYHIFEEYHLSNLTGGVTTYNHDCQAQFYTV